MAEIFSTISQATTVSPIEVVVWVKSGVTAANRNAALAEIQAGLDAWAAVPTSRISFDVVDVIEAAAEPPHLPHQLKIIVGNSADLTSGGASFPWAGSPGTWFGAVADSATVDLLAVTVHEVGHAMGFHHATISEAFPEGNRPAMHWRVAGSSRTPTQDDISAISAAYPSTTNPPLTTTGTIRGRLVTSDTNTPISGVNVVVIDAATTEATVARLSGPRLSPWEDQADGEFLLTSLPAGRYVLRYLDGNSYRGSMVRISLPPDGNTFAGMRAGYQADNFAPFDSAPITVAAGDDLDIGDVEIDITRIDFDGIVPGELVHGSTPTPFDTVLPNAEVGVHYETWLHVTGGLRDLSATFSGLPSTFTVELSGDTRGHNSGVHGNHCVRVTGTPTNSGHYTLRTVLTDAAGRNRWIGIDLSVGPFETSGLLADYGFEGSVGDSSGNGHHAATVGFGEFVPDRDGNAGSALFLDGGGYVRLPDEEAFDLPEFTIHVVLRFDEAPGDDEWIVNKGVRFGNYSLRRAGATSPWAGYATYAHESTTGNWSSIASAAPLPVGSFFCLAVSLSATTFKSYVDGTLVRTVNGIIPPLFNEDPAVIGGGGYYGTSNPFHGVIDSVQFFRGALSDAEVSALCNGSGSGGGGSGSDWGRKVPVPPPFDKGAVPWKRRDGPARQRYNGSRKRKR